jgi:hypothetical protein
MEFTEGFEVQKRLIFQVFEQCRQHLQDLHNSSGANEEPPLQVIVLCDLKKVSYQSLVRLETHFLFPAIEHLSEA